MKTAIVTDSNCGIFQEEADRLGIFTVPMPVCIQDVIYYEGKNLNHKDFLQYLTENKTITTSQPSPGDVMFLWEFILKQGYDEIVYIPMSSGLSGSCQTACMLAEEYPGRVYVADVHRISVTQRHAVFDAVNLAAQGIPAKEIKERLEENAFRSLIYVAVNDLNYLKRGGRITPAAAAMASVLNLKPLLVIKGEQIDACEKIRGQKKCEQRVIRLIKEKAEELKSQGFKIRVGAASTFLKESDIQDWSHLVRQTFTDDEVLYEPLTCSIGCHVGPNAFGMGISAVI